MSAKRVAPQLPLKSTALVSDAATAHSHERLMAGGKFQALARDMREALRYNI